MCSWYRRTAHHSLHFSKVVDNQDQKKRNRAQMTRKSSTRAFQRHPYERVIRFIWKVTLMEEYFWAYSKSSGLLVETFSILIVYCNFDFAISNVFEKNIDPANENCLVILGLMCSEHNCSSNGNCWKSKYGQFTVTFALIFESILVWSSSFLSVKDKSRFSAIS